jgi:hypothetical protein
MVISTIIQIVVSVATFVISIGSSMFIAGARWGRINEDITSIDRRLAKIEAMFTLTLKDGGKLWRKVG